MIGVFSGEEIGQRVLCQIQELGLAVVDLAKDPLV
jgi:hypothetical protein